MGRTSDFIIIIIIIGPIFLQLVIYKRCGIYP